MEGSKLLSFKEFKAVMGEKYKKGNTILPMNTIFDLLPKTVDYRLLDHILKNWVYTYVKSPYSFSLYSKKVGWTLKPNNSERLSDHWNFKSTSGKRAKIHCKTVSEDSKLNNDKWSIGVYDAKIKRYKIIMSFPFDDSEENQKKKEELKKKFLKKYEKELIRINPDTDDDIAKMKLDARRVSEFIHKNKNEFDIFIDGKKLDADILNISFSKLRYDKDGDINVIRLSNKNHTPVDIKVYYGNILIMGIDKYNKGRMIMSESTRVNILNGDL